MLKTVQYEDFPHLLDQLLDEVELNGITVTVIRNGRPYVQMVPVNAVIEGNGRMVRES